MNPHKENINIDILDIYVISSNRYYFDDLTFTLNEKSNKLIKNKVNLNYLKIISENTFSEVKDNCLFFIESKLLVEINGNKINKNHLKRDLIILRDETETEKSIELLKKVIDENILYLLGEIATENLTPLLIQYMSIAFIKQKLNS